MLSPFSFKSVSKINFYPLCRLRFFLSFFSPQHPTVLFMQITEIQISDDQILCNMSEDLIMWPLLERLNKHKIEKIVDE